MHKIVTKIFGHGDSFPEASSSSGSGIHFIVNGWTVSAQAGWGHYCSANPTRNGGVPLHRDTIRRDCEVAIWDDDNNWLDFGGDNVKGWVNWHVVINLVAWLSAAAGKPSSKLVLEFFRHEERLAVEVR